MITGLQGSYCTCKGLIRAGISQPLFFGNILHKERKSRYASNKSIKTLNRLILNGYSYDNVVESLRIAFKNSFQLVSFAVPV